VIPLALALAESFRQNVCMIDAHASSRWTAPVRSMLFAFGFFFLGSLADFGLQLHITSGKVAILDDVLIGMGVGLLVLLYERRHTQHLIRKLEVIRMMNHHVRNSLQVISYASADPPQEELRKNIRDAVERIDWALREVLPGQREDISDLSFHSPLSEAPGEKPKIVA
jgi:hypothetical protein